MLLLPNKLLEQVKIDIESKRVHRAEFNEVVKDIRDRLKIEQAD